MCDTIFVLNSQRMLMSEKTVKKTKPIGVIVLLFTSLIWGTAFTAQSLGQQNVDTFTFNGIRMLIGAVTLLPVILIRDLIRVKKSKIEKNGLFKENKRSYLCGAILGAVLCTASNFQQEAFKYTAAGKIAIITAVYMFLVPIFGLLIKKKTPLLTWICIVIGFTGLYFLSIDPDAPLQLNHGDLLTLVCAGCFAVQILLIERFSDTCDGIKLAFAEFFTAGLISLILMFIFEKPQWENIKNAAFPILYTGVMSCGVAYTFQIIGQKYTEATVASLIMCSESVIGAIASAIILHETMSGREITGCVIMVFAIVLSQIGTKLFAKNKKNGRN